MGTTLTRSRGTTAHKRASTSARMPDVTPVATQDTAHDATPRPARSLLRPLGIVGYDAIEPAILAALATEEPLLLVSEHGAAKSLLLVRLAESLGLALRHYNASILQFDDLAGFPIPDENGGIRYAAPPGAIWDAEVAFFDEIGRCRPDVANKLFPIIHERRIQGVAIPRLRFRWAATNPASDAHDSDDRFSYEGVEVLDPALADRFSWIVPLPRYDDLGDRDRLAIIRGIGETPDAGASTLVRELVTSTCALIPAVRAASAEHIAAYVDVLVARLAVAKIPVGGRRAATLFRNIVAMRAAHLALGRGSDELACQAAVLASIPDIVRRKIPRATLLVAHQAAWQQTSLPDDDPARTLMTVRDPLARLLLALKLPGVPTLARGEVLCTALAELPEAERQVVAWVVLSYLIAEPLVPLAAIETVALIVDTIVFDGVSVRNDDRSRAWLVALRQALQTAGIPLRDEDVIFSVISAQHASTAGTPGADLPPVAQPANALLAVRSACLDSLGPIVGTA
jgi:MoxR-like ATPase